MEPQDPLAQLRDIHLPSDVSAWPPAPGWWLLAVIIIALLCYLFIQIKKYWQRNNYRKLALKQLAELNKDQPIVYLQQLNQLLKQTALVANPSKDIASLSGDNWLAFLSSESLGDKKSLTEFQQGPGQLLAQGPYAPLASDKEQTAINVAALEQLAQQWIKQHQLNRGKAHA
jgi:hypothetical protein